MIQTVAVLAFSDRGALLACCLKRQLETVACYKVEIFSSRKVEGVTLVTGVADYIHDNFNRYDAFVFIGALGICVRTIAPVIGNKYSDPAVLNCDESGVFVQTVLSGHVGGGNEFARQVARLIGARPVITTSSDVQGLWSLDILGREQGWTMEFIPGKSRLTMAGAMSRFVNHEPTVLLLETRDEQTDYLESHKPSFLSIVYDYQEIDFEAFRLFLAVTPRIFSAPVPSFFYRPKVLYAGLGCEKNIDPAAFLSSFTEEMKKGDFHLFLSKLSVPSISRQRKRLSGSPLKTSVSPCMDLQQRYSRALKVYRTHLKPCTGRSAYIAWRKPRQHCLQVRAGGLSRSRKLLFRVSAKVIPGIIRLLSVWTGQLFARVVLPLSARGPVIPNW